MNLLHTPEEIKYWDDRKELSYELSKLNKRFKDDELNILSQEIEDSVNLELAKYHRLIGKKAILKAKSFPYQSEARNGTILEITHFNTFSKSVRCKFQYDNKGFDGVSLLDLDLID